MTTDRWALRAAVSFCLLTILFAGATWINQRDNDSNQSQIRHLAQEASTAAARADAVAVQDRRHEIEACERGNVKTVEQNRSADAIYIFISATVHRTELALRAGTEAPASRAESRVFVRQLTRVLDAQQWVPIIADCTSDVDVHHGNYVVPAAVPFAVRHPPLSALKTPGQPHE